MALSHSLLRPRIPGLLVVVCTLLALPTTADSRVTQPRQSARLQDCRPSDLDKNLELINGPDDLFTGVFLVRNISDSPCLLGRVAYGTYGSPTSPDRTNPNGKLFRVSPDSETRVWGTPTDVPPVLATGKVAYMTIQWKTKPVRETDPCVQTVAINWPMAVVAPGLLGRLCSDISVRPFTLGDFHRWGRAGREPWQAHNNEKLKLAAYGEGDSFYLRLSPTSPHKGRFSPLMYLRERSSDGTTVFRATFPISTVKKPLGGVVVYHATKLPAIDCNSGCDLKPDCYQTVGEHTFQVFQPVHVPKNGPIRFVHSNVVQIRWDESSLPRCRVIVTE